MLVINRLLEWNMFIQKTLFIESKLIPMKRKRHADCFMFDFLVLNQKIFLSDVRRRKDNI